MNNYLALLNDIMTNGHDRMDRTGVGTRALFTKMLSWDLREGFPIVTTKKVKFSLIRDELLWFLSGSSDVRDLQARGCHIWDANAAATYWKPKAKFEGDLGRIYGVQWRKWRSIGPRGTNPTDDIDGVVLTNQIDNLIEGLRTKPYDRRHIVTAWNPGELDQMALPPCHILFQCFVNNLSEGGMGGELSLTMYQRSCDAFLGVPFNISSYALLLSMLAAEVNMQPTMLNIVFGDVHIYKNHFEQVKEQLARVPRALPKLLLRKSILGYERTELLDYDSWPAIKAEMAV